MNVSARDRKILMIIVPLAVVLGYWFLLLSPQRQAATDAAATLETEQTRLAEAETHASTVQAAKANFARDYATVVALGKAIPTSVDMPSLLVQLEQAARGTGIELDGVTMGPRTPASDSAAAPAAPATPGAPDPGAAQPAGTAPSGQPPQSAPGQAAATAQDAANGASAPPAPDAGATATAPTDPAAAGASTAAPASGTLESVSLDFNFSGDFFELADFFHRLKRFVYVAGDKVRVRGRLMTIDSVEYSTDADTFPALSATVSASVFLTPKVEGTTAGATPAGPQAAAAPAPVATADSGSSSPTPTATATP